jgi:hypothetical protein
MMVRDRELATMHRELLELLEKLIHALGSMAGARVGWTATSSLESAIPPPRPEPATAAASEPTQAEPPSGDDSPELQRLRESLAREQETVERLRKARLELEQRLARLKREEGKRGRRR